METRIISAMIAKSQNELDTLLNKVKGKIHRVQLDIMDGDFVPNTSLNFNFTIPDWFKYEAHLMIKNPLKWIKDNTNKIDIIIMHIETLHDITTTIDYVKKRDLQVNLALIPKTKTETVIPYIDKIDGILIMTVEPGSYCIKKEFRSEPLKKIKKIREIDRVIPIEVDGCINPDTIKRAKDAGANLFASGSYILKSDNVDQAIKELKDAIA